MDHEAEELGIPAHAQRADEVVLPTTAAERKRVLNILAQRRYRRRRRDRQAALELLISKKTPHGTNSAQPAYDEDESLATESSHTSNSPSSDDTAASSELAVPYTNGSTWFPDATYPNDDMTALLTDFSWTNDEIAPALNDFLQYDDVQNATFADDFSIAVPELDLLRAAYQIAGRIESSHLLFAGLQAQSVFLTADCSSLIPRLPKNLRPTTAQLTIPHHPLIDVLPWPAVRTRLVRMYSMPSELWPRHPSDGSESSLVRLVYDMEDGGVRVTGGDPSDEDGWEVEQRFFDVWWWALDQSVISISDRKRALRGLPKLSCQNSAGF